MEIIVFSWIVLIFLALPFLIFMVKIIIEQFDYLRDSNKMTQAEQRHIDNNFTEIKNMIMSEVGDVKRNVSDLRDEVGVLKRGIYGDPKNKVKGLIDTDKEQHERIKSLEETRKKALWTVGGFIAAVEGFWHLITSK